MEFLNRRQSILFDRLIKPDLVYGSSSGIRPDLRFASQVVCIALLFKLDRPKVCFVNFLMNLKEELDYLQKVHMHIDRHNFLEMHKI